MWFDFLISEQVVAQEKAALALADTVVEMPAVDKEKGEPVAVMVNMSVPESEVVITLLKTLPASTQV